MKIMWWRKDMASELYRMYEQSKEFKCQFWVSQGRLVGIKQIDTSPNWHCEEKSSKNLWGKWIENWNKCEYKTSLIFMTLLWIWRWKLTNLSPNPTINHYMSKAVQPPTIYTQKYSIECKWQTFKAVFYKGDFWYCCPSIPESFSWQWLFSQAGVQGHEWKPFIWAK